MTRTRSSPEASARSASPVPSTLPSSTTMSSQGTPSSDAATRSWNSATQSRSSSIGATTLTRSGARIARQASLPPAVSTPSELYDRAYFESELCEGWERFRDDGALSDLKRHEVELLAVEPGMRVLDAGCGRGELLLACARAGALVAGADASSAAVAISRETLAGVEGADV